jgi:cytochrome c553
MGPGKLVVTTLLVLLPDDGKPKHLVGSTRGYTYSQIEDSFAPADWYPHEHPKMPEVPVATGRKPDVRACAWCHLPNGVGHPQSANLTGLVEKPGPRTPACVECHGQQWRGLPHAPDSDIPTPPLAGRSPTYIVRQLYDIPSGARSGKTTELMKPVAAQLTLQQMIDAAAYLGSRMP